MSGVHGAHRTLIFGLETPDDLVAIDRDCHERRHHDPAGVYWWDPEAMAEAWAS